MNASVVLTINPRHAVPSDPNARIAWLEKYGAPPAEAKITVTASLLTWSNAGATIENDGTVPPDGRYGQTAKLYEALRDYALGFVREVGRAPETLGEVDVAHCGRVLALERAKEAEEKARREAQAAREACERNDAAVARYVAMTDEELISDCGQIRPTGAIVGIYSLDDDPRVKARVATIDVQGVLAARKRAEEAYAAAIRAIAAGEDDLARAAAEGYPVDRKVLDRLADKLARSIDVPEAHLEVDSSAWPAPEDRAAPSPAAFALYDRVKAAVAKANKTLPTVVGQWELSRIVRIDTCPHYGKHHYVTAVFATLRSRDAVRQVTWSTEKVACGHEEDE